jgi:hypothetical protein
MVRQARLQNTPGERDSGFLALVGWLIREYPRAALRECASVEEWWRGFGVARRGWTVPIDQAVVGGALTDRVGYAVAAGYQSALRCLVPSLPDDRLVSLSVTEEGGAHPRAIMSTLQPLAEPAGEPGQSRWSLSGHKKWATLSCEGDLALVVASTGTDPNGHNHLRVVRVALDAPGVTVRPMPPTSFTPEISHGELHFESVPVTAEDLLPGDGYTCYVRPFRTIEDTHVSAAIVGHLLGVAVRFDWPLSVREELLNLIAGLRVIGTSDPNEPEIHVAFGGFLRAYRRSLETIQPCWEQVPPEIRARWERDVGLLSVAGSVRERRLEAAWKRLHDVPAGNSS